MRNPDPSVMPVCEKRCAECLYSSARIVTDDRARQVIEECVSRGVPFLCHKFTMRGEYAVCRGFYDANPDMLVVRLAERLGRVKDV